MSSIKFDGVRACVFDAYGTLFDVHSAVARYRARLGDAADRVSATWRTKQLEYTWLRSLMDRYVDFWQVTSDGLAFALETNGIDDEALREDLMNAYLSLDCYPEVPEVLKTLKAAGMQTAILSNGSPKMLDAAIGSSKLREFLDACYSVDELRIYKPHASVYQLAVDRLGVAPREISFQSSNAWDAAAAATFGFRVAWCNRFGQAPERLPDGPDAEIKTLSELTAIVLPG